MQVNADAFSWLADYGFVKSKAGKNGAKAATGMHPLPAHVSAGLVSGEVFVKLINDSLAKYDVKPTLVASKDRYDTWCQVAKGVRRLAVELDDETIEALADGDPLLTAELLGELCLVFNNWAAQQAKERKRKQRQRQAQPQQGRYGGARAVTNHPAIASPAVGPRSAAATADAPQGDQGSIKTRAGERYQVVVQDAQSDSATISSPRQVHIASAPTSPRVQDPDGSERDSPRAQEEDSVEMAHQEANVAAKQSPNARERSGQDDVPGKQLPIHRSSTDTQAKPSKVHLDALLQHLSPNTALEAAANGPELLGLSMMAGLRISASQARALLADDARRLSRAFGEANERNASHLERWLKSLMCYCGALAELLLLYPVHSTLLLGALQHGLRAGSATVAEAACRVLAGICAGLAGGGLSDLGAAWLLESSALKDLMGLLVGPTAVSETREAAAALIFDCCRKDLLLLLAQHLKQVSKGEQEYLTSVHMLMLCFLKRQEAVEVCMMQGIFSHFLVRCVQRLGDDRSTAGTQQAAALLASELWLSSMDHKGAHVVAPEGPGDLLAALKRATQSTNWPTLRFVAFSCLSRLLGALCSRRDPDNTPAVYRTFVYALVEAEGAGVRDFAVRNLMELMRQHAGVPVGILVEPMIKKFQAADRETLSVIDIELFLVIAKHPRCTGRHAAMIAQVLARTCVESAEFGRAASLPLLAILHRFTGEDNVMSFFERFLQIVLTRLIQRGVPKEHATHVLEVIAKIACLESPQLEQVIRGMLSEISKAYLLSYESLHPNLQALLDLWPSDDAAIRDWAKSQFFQERPPSHQYQSVDPSGNLDLRSVSPSLKSEPARTPAMQPEGDMPDAPLSPPKSSVEKRSAGLSEAKMPKSSSALAYGQSPGSDSGFGDISEADASPRIAAATAADDARVEQFVREAENLRNELERARERQQKANEEAEALRRELADAQKVHKHLGSEVKELQQRRDGLLRKRDGAANKRSPRRKSSDSKAASSSADLEKATALMKAFREPLHIAFRALAHMKKSRGTPRETLPLQSVEQLFTEMEVVPGRIAKKVFFEAMRAARSRGKDEPMEFDDFLQVLLRVAGQAFQAREASPFQYLGVTVPTEDDPAVQLEVQAMLQHMGSLMDSSAVPALQAARPAYVAALQRFVLNYAQGVLDALNARLDKGEELKEHEIPEGFEVQLQTPPLMYTIPDDLPIPQSERHCVQILDDMLASALGIHFLEASGSTSGPVPKAVVRGHADISKLLADRVATLNSMNALSTPRWPRSAPPAQASKEEISAPPAQASKQSEDHQPVEDVRRGRRPRQTGRRRGEAPREQRRDSAEFHHEPKVSVPPVHEERSEPRRRRNSSQRNQRANRNNNQQQPHESNSNPPQAKRAASASPAPSSKRRAPSGSPAPQAKRAPGGSSPAPQEGREPSSSPPAQAKRERQPPRRRAPAAAPSPAPSPPPRRPAPAQKIRQASSSPARAPDAPSLSPEEAAERETRKRNNDRHARQHSTAVQSGKERSEMIQTTFESPDVQGIVQSMAPSFRRTFDFFQRWKGSQDGGMQVAGFLKLGECFGLLNSNALKVIFRHVGGQGLSSADFPEALFLAAVRVVEMESGAAQISLDHERSMWLKAFSDLCEHMLFSNKDALRRALDSYRRTGEICPEFHVEGYTAGVKSVEGTQAAKGVPQITLQGTQPRAADSAAANTTTAVTMEDARAPPQPPLQDTAPAAASHDVPVAEVTPQAMAAEPEAADASYADPAAQEAATQEGAEEPAAAAALSPKAATTEAATVEVVSEAPTLKVVPQADEAKPAEAEQSQAEETVAPEAKPAEAAAPDAAVESVAADAAVDSAAADAPPDAAGKTAEGDAPPVGAALGVTGPSVTPSQQAVGWDTVGAPNPAPVDSTAAGASASAEADADKAAVVTGDAAPS